MLKLRSKQINMQVSTIVEILKLRQIDTWTVTQTDIYRAM